MYSVSRKKRDKVKESYRVTIKKEKRKLRLLRAES